MNYGVINDRAPHLIADLCEIICYFEETTVSRSDIESFIREKGGQGLFTELEVEEDSSAEANARLQELAEEAFGHLTYRQAAFGNWYPFVANHDTLELREGITDRHRLYATLLADSRLKMFPGAKRAALALEFETICAEAAPGLFPHWRIYHFGAQGADRAHFGNKFKDAIGKLAAALREHVIQEEVDQISDHNVGDGGIDLVAVYDWPDPARSLPIYFAQCAAQQENWPAKRFEAHPLSHELYLNFFHKPGTILFIPVCYRGTNGKWIDSAGHPDLLIDRLRIVQLFDLQIDNGLRSFDAIMGALPELIHPGIFTAGQDAAAA